MMMLFFLNKFSQKEASQVATQLAIPGQLTVVASYEAGKRFVEVTSIESIFRLWQLTKFFRPFQSAVSATQPPLLGSLSTRPLPLLNTVGFPFRSINNPKLALMCAHHTRAEIATDVRVAYVYWYFLETKLASYANYLVKQVGNLACNLVFNHINLHNYFLSVPYFLICVHSKLFYENINEVNKVISCSGLLLVQFSPWFSCQFPFSLPSCLFQ